MHCRAGAVSGHVEKIEDKRLRVEPAISERVTAELRRRDEAPVRPHESARERFGQQGEDVFARPLEIAIQFLGAIDVAAAAALVSQELAAHSHHLTFLQRHRLGQANTVEERAVRGFQILGDDLAVDERHASVTPRELRIVEHERLPRIAPDRDGRVSDLYTFSGVGSCDHHEVVAENLAHWSLI